MILFEGDKRYNYVGTRELENLEAFAIDGGYKDISASKKGPITGPLPTIHDFERKLEEANKVYSRKQKLLPPSELAKVAQM